MSTVRGVIRMKWFSNTSNYTRLFCYLRVCIRISYKIEKVYFEIYWKGFSDGRYKSHVHPVPLTIPGNLYIPLIHIIKKTSEL